MFKLTLRHFPFCHLGFGGSRSAGDIPDGAQPSRVHGALREGPPTDRNDPAGRAGREVPRLRKGPPLQGGGVLQEADGAGDRVAHLHQQQAGPEGGRHRAARVGQEEPARPQGAGALLREAARLGEGAQDLRGEGGRGARRPRRRPRPHALPREARRVGRPARGGRGAVAGILNMFWRETQIIMCSLSSCRRWRTT